MDKREKIIRLWFDMWLQKKDLGIEDIFSADVLYIESWGPQYQGVAKVKHWFEEWNTRGTVLQWDIKQYFHKRIRLSLSGTLRIRWMTAGWRLLME